MAMAVMEAVMVDEASVRHGNTARTQQWQAVEPQGEPVDPKHDQGALQGFEVWRISMETPERTVFHDGLSPPRGRLKLLPPRAAGVGAYKRDPLQASNGRPNGLRLRL